ncbi:MAG: hypothetical protein GXP37_00190 [Chloroflexi bacterium]|nr:hypothetical protein [Chloroflexota bacterium]
MSLDAPSPPSPPESRLNQHRWLMLILAGHLLLALIYSVVVPPWEAHDEWAHYRYAASIAENLALPDPSQRLTTEFEFDEASQPPLYYLLAAVPMLAVDTEDGYHPVVNPYAIRGTGMGGVNFVVHDPSIEGWPWRGTMLALHLGRLVSALLSTLGLYITFLLARLLSPRRPSVALIATALQAFTPQYIFLSAVMTNDILLIVLETALLTLSLRVLHYGPDLRRMGWLGLMAGLTLLTKYLALAVLPLLLVVVIMAWRRSHNTLKRRQVGAACLLMLGVMTAVGGALLARNVWLTGMLFPRDPLSQAAILGSLTGAGSLQFDWQAIPAALRYGFETYWVSFGWGNVATATWVYGVWLGIWLSGMVGFIVWLRQAEATRARSLWLPLILFLAAVISLPLVRELIHESVFLRGRYILSTLPLIAWMIAQGWAQLSGRYWPQARKVLIAWPVGLSIVLIPTLIIPAYSPPPSQAAAPTSELFARFDDVVELLRYDIWPEGSVEVGDGLAVTLSWRVLGRTSQPYTLAVHLVGAGQQSYGSVTTYPGDGNAATTVWQPGTVFSETYWLIVKDNGPTPTGGQIAVTLFNESDHQLLPVFDPAGQPAGDAVRFGSIRIDAAADANRTANPSPQPLARFDDALILTAASIPSLHFAPGWGVPVLLRWQALAPISQEIKLSIQLLTNEGVWLAGNDGPPSTNLPPDLWQAGDTLHATRWLQLPHDLPPGSYTLIATFYRTADLQRLPATDAAGQPLPHDAFVIGDISVIAPPTP